MIIQHNMAAMNTNRQLGISQGALSKSTEKLSSGYRINRAGDDAAGLAISEKMRSQIRGLDRASANSQDGISLIQTAEGALNESQNILQRMRELAVQAANGTNTDSDREEIQKEINQLTSEINRIANTTEFNTMKLLKGADKKSEIDSFNAETLKEGAAGKLAGLLSNFEVDKESKIGKESTAILKGATSEPTGKIKEVELDSVTEGTVGTFSKTTVAGVEFKATNIASGAATAASGAVEALNKTKIQIVSIDDTYVDSTGASPVTKETKEGILKGKDKDGNDVICIAIKQSRITEETTAADLKAFVSTLKQATGTDLDALKAGLKDAQVEIDTTAATTSSDTLAKFGIEVGLPEDVATGDDNTTKLPTKVGDMREGIMQGGKKESGGEYKFTISQQFTEDDDVIVVAGERFTAKSKNVDADAGEFNILDAAGTAIGSTADQAASLVAAMQKNANLKDIYNISADANGVITLKEKEKHGGAGLKLDKSIQVLGGGENNSITITNPGGTNDEVRFKLLNKKNGGNNTTSDATVTVTAGPATDKPWGIEISIDLGTTTNGNKASKIQQAIRDLGVKELTYMDKDNIKQTKKVDFSKFIVEANGNWDKETTNLSTVSKDVAGLGGGIEEQNGEYSFDIASSFAEGDQATILGKSFIAKKGNADVYKGEFDVTSNSKSTQAANLAAALNQDKDISSKYSVKAKGSKLIITENEISGKDIEKDIISVQSIGTTGQFKVDLSKLLEDGAILKIDDQEIEVSSKNEHTGYENGTAIKVADSVENQNAAIIDAINKNAELSKKYSANVASDGKLVFTQKIGSENGPDISAIGSDKGTFDVTFQVGANTGQSMTIAIGDNRAAALGVAGDGSSDTVMADNGAKAYYTKAQTVTDGTSNDNIEYALDITSYEKATAAIGVIDDALSAISAQRSQLGAYQNRLEHTIANLDNTSENLQSAESRIRDVDMAEEMTNFSKNNILQQAAQSMLAQANQSTQGVLTLLR